MEPPTPRRTLGPLAGRPLAALQSRHPPTARRRPRPRLIPSAADPLRSGPKSGIAVRRRRSRSRRHRQARSGPVPPEAETLSPTVQTFPPLASIRVARAVPPAVPVAPVAVEAAGVVAAPVVEDQAVPAPAGPAAPAAMPTGGRTAHAETGGSQLPDPGQQMPPSQAASAPMPALPAARAAVAVAGVHSEPEVDPPPSRSTTSRRSAPRRRPTPSAPPGGSAAIAAASPPGAT